MISALFAIVVGWLLAAKVKSTWIGVAGCIGSGVIIGTAAVLFSVQASILPVNHARIPDAVFESSILFSVLALVIYAIQRFMTHKANKPSPVRRPMPSGTRKCPYCAETIKAQAIVCKHCGRDVPISEIVMPERADNTESTSSASDHDSATASLSPEASMRLYGITYANKQYVFEEYRYDRLDDAINYGKLVAKRR